MNFAYLSNKERIMQELSELYGSYGYLRYKMSKFEEYDLYAGNKDFLAAEEVITFNDFNGRLMALKPDVTLSIVRNSRPESGFTQKVYYDENVYRRQKSAGAVREIRQIGLEAIGPVGIPELAEVLVLAARSLKRISGESILVLSEPDILAGLLRESGTNPAAEPRLLRLIGEKNAHELRKAAKAAGAEDEATEKLVELMQLAGTPAELLPKLKAFACASDAVNELEQLNAALTSVGLADMLRLDFSLVGDMNYYNGLIFKGFVPGVPGSVLSGGRYDRLMKKMGSVNRAAGFAVYPDELDGLPEKRPVDADMLLLYETEDAASLCLAMKKLTAEGLRVQAQRSIPEGLKYRQLARLENGEVKILE